MLFPKRVLGVWLVLTAAVLVSACAKPVAPLNGQIAEVEIIVPEGKLAVVDWQQARVEAGKDGFTYTRPPPDSNKPTREETLAIAAIDEQNAAYNEHVNRPEILLQAQAIAIPKMENLLLQYAANPFEYVGVDGMVAVNSPDGPPMKLILSPAMIMVTPRQDGQEGKTDYKALAVVGAGVLIAGPLGGQLAAASLDQVGDGLSTHGVFVPYELVEIASGRIVQRGEVIEVFRPDRHGSLGITGPHFPARAILVKVLRDAEGGG